MFPNRLGHFINVGSYQMVRHDMRELGEPELRECRQHFSFARNRCRRNTIKGGNAIGGDNQKSICVDFVNVTHFAAAKEFEVSKSCFENGRYRCHEKLATNHSPASTR